MDALIKFDVKRNLLTEYILQIYSLFHSLFLNCASDTIKDSCDCLVNIDELGNALGANCLLVYKRLRLKKLCLKLIQKLLFKITLKPRIKHFESNVLRAENLKYINIHLATTITSRKTRILPL